MENTHARDIASESAGDPFDYPKLLEEWDGNAEFLRKLLETFSCESASDLAGLEKAFAADDAVQVARLAHRIKGSAGVVGVQSVCELAAMIEAHVKRRGLNNAIVYLETLRAELKRCDDFLASLKV